MFIKALLPLIAILKFKCDGHEGKYFGKQIAQVYQACKGEINQAPAKAQPAEPTH